MLPPLHRFNWNPPELIQMLPRTAILPMKKQIRLYDPAESSKDSGTKPRSLGSTTALILTMVTIDDAVGAP